MQTLFPIEVPDGADLQAMRQRTGNAFALVYGWRPTLPNGQPNPETKAQFTKRKTAEYVRSIIEQAEGIPAGDVARDAAVTKVRNEVVVS